MPQCGISEARKVDMYLMTFSFTMKEEHGFHYLQRRQRMLPSNHFTNPVFGPSHGASFTPATTMVLVHTLLDRALTFHIFLLTLPQLEIAARSAPPNPKFQGKYISNPFLGLELFANPLHRTSSILRQSSSHFLQPTWQASKPCT